MKTASDLGTSLRSLDGKGYKAYKAIAGAWDFGEFTLYVDHVQGDPFALPSRIRVLVPAGVAELPPPAFRSPIRCLGTAACLARAFDAGTRRSRRTQGSGRSGDIDMEAPGQEVVPQTAVQVAGDGSVEARFTVGLPARGRRILGQAAARLLTEEVADIVLSTLTARGHDVSELVRHAEVNEDAEFLRGQLLSAGLVAFVADGALLPRRSGVDDRPLQGKGVVRFTSPPSLRVSFDLPNAGTVSGMGIPGGVTLVVGGGFHGKSTLLRALQAGVYNHRPGDGRERVVAVPEAVKIRAEDGRSVQGVDISPFIDGLPMDENTRAFSSPNASGSTSQAAAIVEALEAGCRVLLIDEDTSATNFMIRDRRMQALVPKAGEPITPFVDRVKDLARDEDVSAVLVLGGSGDYLDVADTVIAMRDYEPHDVTEQARSVAAAFPTGRVPEATEPFPGTRPRRPRPGCLDPAKGRRDVSVKVPDDRTLLFGREAVDLAAVEQLLSRSQIRAVGRALAVVARDHLGAGPSIPDILDRVEAAVSRAGLDALDSRRVGDLAAFRRFELAAALNRIRSLRVD